MPPPSGKNSPAYFETERGHICCKLGLRLLRCGRFPAFIIGFDVDSSELLRRKQMPHPIMMVSSVTSVSHNKSHILYLKIILKNTVGQSIMAISWTNGGRCSSVFSAEAIQASVKVPPNVPPTFLKYIQNWLWSSFSSPTWR